MSTNKSSEQKTVAKHYLSKILKKKSSVNNLILKRKKNEKIAFESSSNQNFSIDKNRKYLFDFANLSANDVVEFDFTSSLTKGVNDKKEFGIRKSEQGDLELFLYNGYLTAPIKFYDAKGKLLKTIQPNYTSSSIQTKGWGLAIVVAAVVLCCVELEYSYSEKDGHAFKAGFDCDCLSISL